MKSIFFTLCLVFMLEAQMLEVSQKVDAIKLNSQHGDEYKLIENGIWLIAWSKETTNIANTYFSKHPMQNNTNFIVDTSAIPSGIFSLFVRPKMKRFKHTILFSFDENYNILLPYKEDKLTLLYIKDAKISKIEFVETLKELEESFK